MLAEHKHLNYLDENPFVFGSILTMTLNATCSFLKPPIRKVTQAIAEETKLLETLMLPPLYIASRAYMTYIEARMVMGNFHWDEFAMYNLARFSILLPIKIYEHTPYTFSNYLRRHRPIRRMVKSFFANPLEFMTRACDVVDTPIREAALITGEFVNNPKKYAQRALSRSAVLVERVVEGFPIPNAPMVPIAPISGKFRD